MRYRLILLWMLMWGSQIMVAQGTTSPDYMRSIGKIYVVAAVCLIILVTLLIYLVRLDRKISNLEKRQNHE